MPDNFSIPPASYPDEQRLVAAVANQLKAMMANREEATAPTGQTEVRHAVPPHVVKAMADIVTNAWKARVKMLDSSSGEVREEMKRVYRHVEGIITSLHDIGLELKDYTGEPFDYGLPLTVVTSQPTAGVSREIVIETIKPTIYWQQKLIQNGEVVIATPISGESSK